MATTTATKTLGEQAAARCEDCKQAKDAGYAHARGWFTDDDGLQHNHLQPFWWHGETTTLPSAISLTAEEVTIAAQMGISREALMEQKARDRTADLRAAWPH